MKITFDAIFELGEIVYLKTDIDQKPRILIYYKVDTSNEVLYCVNQATYESYHYSIELSRTKDVIITSTN